MPAGGTGMALMARSERSSAAVEETTLFVGRVQFADTRHAPSVPLGYPVARSLMAIRSPPAERRAINRWALPP
jgi:hypothetical protein